MLYRTFLSLASLAVTGTASAEPVPAKANGVQTLTTPNNITIRYKEPGKEGVCETTPGVKSYSGYVDLSPTSHTFFYFFEARHDPQNAPITLWLNGGPGSDSLIGLFEELGPCHINSSNQSYINPHSWNEVSNMLFISQPLGAGFSYSDTQVGSLNPLTGEVEGPEYNGVQGRFPVVDASAIDTTNAAARATWEVLQGFLGSLPKLDSKVKSKKFNLWTESYGGHYGPAFFKYFESQNEKIKSGQVEGIPLDFHSLGIINGIIDEAIQANYYPEFANHNTYGIQAVNETVYNYMRFANRMPNGCQDQLALCAATNRTTLSDYALCTEASNMCRDNVEGPYYQLSGRGVYDIRHPADDPTPPQNFLAYLEQPAVKNALGVDLNYTMSNNPVYFAFQQTGDQAWPNFLADLEEILDLPVRVTLIYGDADYICNWFGGEAVSLAANYTAAPRFRQAGYVPFVVDGTQLGETRQVGNFSFTRVYEAGHEVPYYQPAAALQLFNRTLQGVDIPEGVDLAGKDFETQGEPVATHTRSLPLPSSTSSK